MQHSAQSVADYLARKEAQIEHTDYVGRSRSSKTIDKPA
jgi:hypothetical protein